MNTENKLILTADCEVDYIGIEAKWRSGRFGGAGVGWFNNQAVQHFCDDLRELSARQRPQAELIGGQGTQAGFFETFGLRCYPLDQTSENSGLVGVHVTLGDTPRTDCRPEEKRTASGELLVRNYHLLQFTDDLMALMHGDLPEVILWGDGRL